MVSLPGGNGYLLGGLTGEVRVGVSERKECRLSSVVRTEAGRVPLVSGTRVLGNTCDTGPILATSSGGRRVGIGIGMMSSVTSGRQHTHNRKKKKVGRTRPKHVHRPPESLYFAPDPQDMHERQYYCQQDSSADRTAYDRDEMRGRPRVRWGPARQTTAGDLGAVAVVTGGEGEGSDAGF